MLADGATRVSHYSFLYALAYFEGYGDGLEGEAVRVVGAGPRRGHRVDGVLLDPARALREEHCESTAWTG